MYGDPIPNFQTLKFESANILPKAIWDPTLQISGYTVYMYMYICKNLQVRYCCEQHDDGSVGHVREHGHPLCACVER